MNSGNIQDAMAYGGMPKGNYAALSSDRYSAPDNYPTMRISIEYSGRPEDLAKVLDAYGFGNKAQYGTGNKAPAAAKAYSGKGEAEAECTDPACPHHGVFARAGGLEDKLYGNKPQVKGKSYNNTKSNPFGTSNSNAYEA